MDRNLHTLSAILLGSASLTAPSLALAADPGATPAARAGVDAVAVATTGGVADIVVVARKRAESAQTVPETITALDQSALKQEQIQGIRDLHTAVPAFSDAPGGADLFSPLYSLRGISMLNLGQNTDPTVGLYIDGVYQGESAGNLNQNDLQSLQVLEGPQGTLFGRNSTGGAILMNHNLPTGRFEGSIEGGFGDYGEYHAEGVVNIPIVGDQVDLRLVGGYLNENGYGTATIGPRHVPADPAKAAAFLADFVASGGILTPAGVTQQPTGDMHAGNFLATLRLRPTPKWDVLLRASYDSGVSGDPAGQMTWISPAGRAAGEVAAEGGNPATLVQGVNPANQNSMLDGLDVNRGDKLQGSATISYQVNDNLQLKSITAYVKGHRYLQQDYSQTQFSIGTAVQNTTEELITEEFQITGSAIDNRLKYTAGAFYYHKNATDRQFGFFFPVLFGAIGGAITHAPTAVHVTSVSGYAQGTFAVTPKLNITGGLRYTAENKDLEDLTLANPYAAPFLSSSTNVSYLGEIDYTPVEHVMGYFKTSSGYRSGGPQASAGGIIPPFGQETVTDYELGLKSDLFDRRLRLNMDLYHEGYIGVQQTVFFPKPGGGLLNGTQNIGDAVVDGFELQTTAIPIENLTLNASLSIMDPRYTKIYPVIVPVTLSTPVGNVQRYAYSLSGDYRIPAAPGDIDIHLDWHWQSSTVFNAEQQACASPTSCVPPGGEGTRFQQPYGLLNARISFKPGNGDLELALWAKNLGNQPYFTYINDQSASLGFTDAYSGAPRTIGVDVTWKFH